jgi:hypothetical protein
MAHKEIPGNPSTAKSSQIKLNDRSNGQPLRLLSEDDWAFWVKNGYVIIKNAVPREHVKKLADYLWEYEDKNPDDMDSWYKRPNVKMEMKELNNTGMVEIYNHSICGITGNSPKCTRHLHIWGGKTFWVTIDRANLNFP